MATVLVVDDDADLRRAVGRALDRAGHAVIQASDGRAALEAVQGKTIPDLILTDLEMPERTGLDVIATTRREHAGIPIIAMTGKGRPLSVLLSLARRCGADAAIAKPFSLSAMTDLVAHFLAGTGAPDLTTKAGADQNGDMIVVVPPNQETANADPAGKSIR